MKLMKRSGIYQASNYKVTFNPKTIQAYSYQWWKFVSLVEGKVIFNNYRYSPTTSKHQSKVRALMNELGIKIDIELPLRDGLQVSESLAELIQLGEEELCNMYLVEETKRDNRNAKARQRRIDARNMAISTASHESQTAHMNEISKTEGA